MESTGNTNKHGNQSSAEGGGGDKGAMTRRDMLKLSSVAGVGVAAAKLGFGKQLLGNVSKSGGGYKASVRKVLRVGADDWVFGKYPMSELATHFAASYPGVEVAYTRNPNSTYTQYLLEWHEGRSTVDLVIGPDPELAAAFIAAGLLESWDGMFDAGFKASDLVSSYYDVGKIGNASYVVPFLGSIIDIGVLKNAASSAGVLLSDGSVRPPNDLGELFDYAHRMTAVSGGRRRYGLSLNANVNWEAMRTYFSYLRTHSGSLYLPGTKAINLSYGTDEPLLSQWRRSVQAKECYTGTFTDSSADRTAMASGDLAMMWGPWEYTYEVGAKVGLDKVAWIDIPGTAEHGSFVDTLGVIMPKAGANREWAYRFVREEFLGEAAQLYAAHKYGKPPVVRKLYDKLPAMFTRLLPIAERSAAGPLYANMEQFLPDLANALQGMALGTVSGVDGLRRLRSEAASLRLKDLR